MKHIEVVVARLENMVSEPGVSAATSIHVPRDVSPRPTLVLAAHFIAPGGTAYLWKGSQREAEMAGDPRWQKSWDPDGEIGIGNGRQLWPDSPESHRDTLIRS